MQVLRSSSYRGPPMPRPQAKVVNCECGLIVRGEDDEELFEKVQSHISDHHPDLVGTVTREDLLSMAEEE
jgi:predicted small metal-binding protein